MLLYSIYLIYLASHKLLVIKCLFRVISCKLKALFFEESAWLRHTVHAAGKYQWHINEKTSFLTKSNHFNIITFFYFVYLSLHFPIIFSIENYNAQHFIRKNFSVSDRIPSVCTRDWLKTKNICESIQSSHFFIK